MGQLIRLVGSCGQERDAGHVGIGDVAPRQVVVWSRMGWWA